MDTIAGSSGGSGGGSGVPTPHAGHTRDIVVPRLDEEMLGVSSNFAVVGQDSLPGQQPQPQLSTTPFMYDVLSPAHTADANAVTMALLQQQQQQQQQVVAAAAAQLEQDYLQTRVMLQRCPRNALLMILTSLLDEFPTTMVGLVRLRLEQVMATRAATAAAAAAAAAAGQAPQQLQLPSPTAPLSAARTPNYARPQGTSGGNGGGGAGSTFVPNSAAAPWTPSSQMSYLTAASLSSGGVGSSSMGGGSVGTMSLAATTPMATAGASGAGGGTPYSSSPLHRKGRTHKSKEEEQEMCSVHNCMRSTKHLQVNSTTGKYECVHGFHCLVDSPLITVSTVQQQQQQQQRDKHGSDEAPTGDVASLTMNAVTATASKTHNTTTNGSSGNSNNNNNSSHHANNSNGGNNSSRSHAAAALGHESNSSGNRARADRDYHIDVADNKRIVQYMQQQQQQQQQQQHATVLHHDVTNGFDALHDNARTAYDTNSPSDEVLKLDMQSLQNLLESVREFDKEDSTS